MLKTTTTSKDAMRICREPDGLHEGVAHLYVLTRNVAGVEADELEQGYAGKGVLGRDLQEVPWVLEALELTHVERIKHPPALVVESLDTPALVREQTREVLQPVAVFPRDHDLETLMRPSQAARRDKQQHRSVTSPASPAIAI